MNYSDMVNEKEAEMRSTLGGISGSLNAAMPKPSPLTNLEADLQEFTSRIRELSYCMETTVDRIEGPQPEAASSLNGVSREPSSIQDWCIELRTNLCRLERQVNRLT